MHIHKNSLAIIFLLVTLSIILFVGWGGKRGFANKHEYNLILISVDTLRADHMGVYGYGEDTTPNIDRWTEDATVFTNAYTAFPLTGPSFISLHTGRHPFQTEIYVNENCGSLSQSTKTASDILKAEGYSTAALLTGPVLSSENCPFVSRFDTYKNYNSMDSSDSEHGQIATETINWLNKNNNNKGSCPDKRVIS